MIQIWQVIKAKRFWKRNLFQQSSCKAEGPGDATHARKRARTRRKNRLPHKQHVRTGSTQLLRPNINKNIRAEVNRWCLGHIRPATQLFLFIYTLAAPIQGPRTKPSAGGFQIVLRDKRNGNKGTSSSRTVTQNKGRSARVGTALPHVP